MRLVFVFSIIAFGIYWSLRGSFYALLFYMWNAYFRPEDWVWNGPLIASLNLSFIVGAYLVIRTLLDGPRLRFNSRVALIALFLAQCIVGTVTSEHFDISSGFLMLFTKSLLISYLIVIHINDRRRFRLALFVMAASIGFEASKQGWLNLLRNPGAPNDNHISYLGDNNGVALGMMMLTPLFGGLAAATVRRWERFGYRFAQVGVVMRGLTTYSRGGFLGAAVVGIATLFRSEHKVRALLAIAAVSGVIWVTMPQAFWDRMQTISSDDSEAAGEGRTHFWDVGLTMAKARPLTGVGLYGYNASYDQYDPGTPYGSSRAAHSSWFGVLGDLGFPGLILFAGNLAMALWSCWRVVRLNRSRDRPSSEMRGYANALAVSLLAFTVCGTFLSEQYNEMCWHLIALCSALYFVAAAEQRVTAQASVPAQAPAPTFALAAR